MQSVKEIVPNFLDVKHVPVGGCRSIRRPVRVECSGSDTRRDILDLRRFELGRSLSIHDEAHLIAQTTLDAIFQIKEGQIFRKAGEGYGTTDLNHRNRRGADRVGVFRNPVPFSQSCISRFGNSRDAGQGDSITHLPTIPIHRLDEVHEYGIL